MIKIESWFPKDIREEYLYKMISKLNMKKDDQIGFLPDKTIDLKTLLVGTREEVFKVDGIQEYFDSCQFTINHSRCTDGLEHNKLNENEKIDYNKIDSGLRHKLLSSLHIKCCPYCNRQYITVWNDEKNKPHSTADLDHFYQKDTYPLFALSLFNLVPSCQICNSRMKGSKKIATLYPYEEGMDVFRFHCEPKQEKPDSLVDLWLANNTRYPDDIFSQYEIKLLDESSNDRNKTAEELSHIERIRGSIEMFHLEEVYQTHLEAAINEILKIRIYFSGDYAKYAQNTFEEIGMTDKDGSLKDIISKNAFSEDEMRNIILGFVYDGQDNLDQPLGKMLNDLLENELKVKRLFNDC